MFFLVILILIVYWIIWIVVKILMFGFYFRLVILEFLEVFSIICLDDYLILLIFRIIRVVGVFRGIWGVKVFFVC